MTLTETHAGSTRPTRPRSTVAVLGPVRPGYDRILTPEALELVGRLDAAFAERRCALLAARARRRAAAEAGTDLGFLTSTRWVRTDPGWKVAPAAPGLVDRRVTVSAPTDRRSAEAAMASGAQVWLADQEDGTSPTWDNVVGGQLTLLEASLGRLTHPSSTRRRPGAADEPQGPAPTVVVRPRGWHLPEKHLRLDGRPLSGALVDFGLYLFHCGRLQLQSGRGPYFCLPKLEGHLEARLWNDVFLTAQALLGLPRGSIRATVVVETLPAAFEMEEMLFELREHAAGLDAGPWGRPRPDRPAGTTTAPSERALTALLVATSHKRGAHATTGTAVAVPDRWDPVRAAAVLQRVREDQQRAARDGFDGSWVAHPDLVPTCHQVFEEALDGRPNQVHRHRPQASVTAADLRDLGGRADVATAAGVRTDVSTALRYLAAWLGGRGTVVLDGLVQDTAAAEASCSRLWQWVHHGALLDDGRTVTAALFEQVLAEELAAAGEGEPLGHAAALLREAVQAGRMPAAVTTAAYARHLVTPAAVAAAA